VGLERALERLPQPVVVDDRAALELVGVLVDQPGVLDAHRASGERLDLHEGVEPWHCSIGVPHEG
jgi:hypothetical protein